MNYDDIKKILEPILIIFKLTDNIDSKFVSFDKYGLILYVAEYTCEYWKELFLFEFRDNELHMKDFVIDSEYTFNKEKSNIDYIRNFIQEYKIKFPVL